MLNQETNLKRFQTGTDQIFCAILNSTLKRELRKSAFSFLAFCPQQKSELFDSMIFHGTKCTNTSATMFIVALICAVIPITGTNTMIFTFHFSNYSESNAKQAKNLL